MSNVQSENLIAVKQVDKPTIWKWIRSLSGLSGADINTLKALAARANQEGACWPSYRTLVKDTGESERTVRRAIGRLTAAGLLVKKFRYKLTGRRTSNLYLLQVGAQIARGVQVFSSAPAFLRKTLELLRNRPMSRGCGANSTTGQIGRTTIVEQFRSLLPGKDLTSRGIYQEDRRTDEPGADEFWGIPA